MMRTGGRANQEEGGECELAVGAMYICIARVLRVER
jgi:hypothetical protein